MFIAAYGLSFLAVSSGYYSLRGHCGGFFSWKAQALGLKASLVAASRMGSFSVWLLGHMDCSSLLAYRLSSFVSPALECMGFSHRGSWVLLLHSICNLPGPGKEPMSPALAGRFLSTAPLGKSKVILFINLTEALLNT